MKNVLRVCVVVGVFTLGIASRSEAVVSLTLRHLPGSYLRGCWS